ncbi:MAG: hypothetical protein Crog4KO_03550 [Crocinitomicaceae bacterium]
MRTLRQTQLYAFLLFAILSLGAILTSCGGDDKNGEKQSTVSKKTKSYNDTLEMQKDSLDIDSEYDMETVDRKHQKEFMENLAKIEDEFGEQWDFCTCIVKNDSINKASMQDLPDPQFDKLMDRMDYVDNKCKAFLVQSQSQTPEERYIHEQKVKKCLKAAGIK